MALITRTYTFVDGSTAYGSQVESEIANIVNKLNNLNTGTDKWGVISITHGTSVPLTVTNETGTQNILEVKDNASTVFSVADGGAVTATGVVDVTGQLKGKGTATNDDAAAGYIGQYLSAADTAGSTNAPTTEQWGDLVSISVTAGDWDVTGLLIFDKTASVTEVRGAITSTSGNNGAGQVWGSNYVTALPCTTGGASPIVIPIRLSVASTTTYYLKMLAVYTGTAPKVVGNIAARRVR